VHESIDQLDMLSCSCVHFLFILIQQTRN